MLISCLVLFVWWAHRRVERREYIIFLASALIVCLPFVWLAHYFWYSQTGPNTGIETLQIPLGVAVAGLVMLVPTKPAPLQKGLRFGLALFLGWLLMLAPAWIS
jgi:hypothetical protein